MKRDGKRDQYGRLVHLCSVEGCDRWEPSYMCKTHTFRLKKHGDTGPGEIRRMLPAGTTPAERIDLIGWTVDADGCWLWNGRVDDLMHSCDKPRCINPEHLTPGTQRENIHDMWAKGRAKPWGREQGDMEVRAS